MTAEPSIISVIEADPTIAYQSPEKMGAYIEAVKAENANIEYDLSTATSRKAIASAAYAIAKKKSALDEAGKKVKEEAQKRVNAVNEMRRLAKDTLTEIQETVRAPLTRWEEQEKARVDSCNAIIEDLKQLGIITIEDTSKSVSERLRRVEAIQVTESDFQELADIAFHHRTAALTALRNAKAMLIKQEEERMELARLRAEREAQEKAEQERLAKEQAEKEARERQERIERERIEAEKRAAEQARLDAERRAKEEIEAKERAHQEELARMKALQEAEKREQLEAEARAMAERERQEREEKRRRENQEHRAKIMGAAKEAIMEHGGVSEAKARQIVLSIAGGSIPHVTINF